MQTYTMAQFVMPCDQRFCFRMDVDDRNLCFDACAATLLEDGFLPEGTVDKAMQGLPEHYECREFVAGGHIEHKNMLIQASWNNTCGMRGLYLTVEDTDPLGRLNVEASMSRDGRWFTVRCNDPDTADAVDLIHRCKAMAAKFDYAAEFKLLEDDEPCEWL